MNQHIRKIKIHTDFLISMIKDLELDRELSPMQKEVTIEMVDIMKQIRKSIQIIERLSK